MMKVLSVLLLVVVMVGMCNSASLPPLARLQHNILAKERQAEERLFSAVSNLLLEFKKITKDRFEENDDLGRKYDLMSLLHLLGLSDEDILNFLQYVEDAALGVADELTVEEKLKFENAGMDLLTMLNNGSFRLNAAVGDLSTIKKVLYPHIGPSLQNTLDDLEQCILKMLDFFGYM